MGQQVVDQQAPRKGENAEAPYRSDRVFQQGQYWYFYTREAVRIGPFDNRDLAAKGANDYASFAIEADPIVLSSLSR